MRLNKRLRKLSAITADIIFLFLAFGIFIYSGYKIAENLKIFPVNVFGVESCSSCSSCEGDNWLSDLCKTIRDWCKNSCPCHPTATPLSPVPTPTTVEPTPTSVQPSPTPTPTAAVETPTPTGEVNPTLTPTPTSGPSGIGGESGGGGGGGGGGGPASPCVPPEAPKAPVLISAEIISSTEVRLTWTKVDRADHYAVAYGTASRNYTYGNPDVGNTDSYVVGNLVSGKTYFFVISAGIGGGCPVASPYSNEVSSSRSQGGVLGIRNVFLDPEKAVGGKKEEGEIGGGISTQAGDVAGAKIKGACPFWWIVLLGQTLLLGGLYTLLLKKKQLPKHWWLTVPSSVIFAYLVDRYAHTYWYSPSRWCQWELKFGALLAATETAGFKLLRKRLLKSKILISKS